MNENREGRLSEEQESYLKLLEASPGWKPEVIKLVREDFYFGLTKDQVVKYVKKNSDIQRMKLYSACLRKGYAQEDVDVLMDENLDVYRCQAAVEFYGKGVPIEVVKKIMGDTHNAKGMQLLFQEFVKQKEELSQQEEVPSYAKQLLSQISDIVGQIQRQDQLYEELQRAVAVMSSSKKEEEIRERLQKELEDREVQISSQQDELNRGHKKVAKQREEIERLEKEIENLKATIASLETKLREKEELTKTMSDKNTVLKEPQIPVYYSVPVTDQGKVVGSVQVEHSKRNSNAPQGIFSKLCGAFLPNKDLVKKVIDANLDEQQLVQIRIAMEKKLTDVQMDQIINPALSPMKMKEIIDLAVLINQNL